MNQMFHKLYEVFTTNADLEQIKLVHQGYDRDIAESVMLKEFVKTQYSGDFMLYEHNSQEALALLFSERTKRLRNEC